MTPSSAATDTASPVPESARITSLDLVRGVAVLGILLMNVVSFRFDAPQYFNLSAGGSLTWLDWAVGVLGEVFVDQKFMGLFSLLFGAGMVIFLERAEAKGVRPALLSLWRNTLLLAIGILHFALWDGDVLMLYAVSSAIVVGLRRLRPKSLIAVGVVIFLLPVGVSLLAQHWVNTSGASLAGIWTPSDEPPGDIGIVVILNYALRALGMILIGAGLYRLGFMGGGMATRTYRRIAVVGIGVGLTLAAAGVAITALGGFSERVAFIGQIPNTLGTIPAALGYMSILIIWNGRADSALKRRLRAVGRMALTNYLTQTVLGVLVLTVLLGDNDAVNRSALLLFVALVWGLQVWWSQVWLLRFRYGPAEWVWRIATYRRMQPLRR